MNELDIPPSVPLPNTNIDCPCFFTGDGGFALKKYLMVPYRKSQYMSVSKKIFNIRLSNGRKIIERAFGLMCKKWKIFETPLDFKLSTSEIIIMCCVCLHNYIIIMAMEENEVHNGDINEDNGDDQDDDSSESDDDENSNEDESDDYDKNADADVDNEETDDELEDNDGLPEENLDGLAIRNLLAEYFISPNGNLEWQWKKI